MPDGSNDVKKFVTAPFLNDLLRSKRAMFGLVISKKASVTNMGETCIDKGSLELVLDL